MIAALLAGGVLHPSQRLRRLAAEAELVIAADSGIRHASSLEIAPDLVVGDFDSVTPEDLARYRSLPQQRHPADKSQLDLELALEAGRRRGARSFLIFGAFGGRLDQTIASLLIAARWRRQGFELALFGDHSEAYPLLAGDERELEAPPGRLFSLLNLQPQEDALISVSGAAYPLDHTALPFGVGLGVSNRTTSHEARVTVHGGLIALLVEAEGAT